MAQLPILGLKSDSIGLPSFNIIRFQSPQELLLVFTIALAVVVTYALYVFYLQALHNIPGPFWARFARLWFFDMLYRGDSHQTFIKLHEKYGPVVRITHNMYSFNDPEDQKKIYDLKGAFRKTAYYDTAGLPNDPNIFNVRDEADHSNRRRGIQGLYSMSSMVNYEDAVDEMNAVCIRKLRQFVDEGRAVPIPQFMQYYAFDVIGEITMSTGMQYANTVGVYPAWHSMLFRLNALIGGFNASTIVADVSIAQLDKHRQQLIEKPDPKSDPFITKLLKLEASGKINMTHMMDSIGGNIAAGSDTTAITLSAALYYLYRMPEKLAVLRKEIDDAAAEGRVSDPITFKEAQTLPYLQAVIAEALRIHPAVEYILEREVPEGGVELAGNFFPAGVCSWALHRNKEIYGADAAEFRPERHLSDDSNNKLAALTSSFSFGGGKRTCIGKNISLLEMGKVPPQIVRQFDLVLVDKPWELSTAWFVWQKYSCTIKSRQSL